MKYHLDMSENWRDVLVLKEIQQIGMLVKLRDEWYVEMLQIQ